MEYLKVWTSFREIIEPLTDAEKGRLFVSMLEYAETGTEPQLSGNERYVWPSARQSIKRTSDENERMKAMGKKGGRPKAEETYENLQKPTETYENPNKDKDKDNIKETTLKSSKEKRERFSPPSVEDVKAYCQERKNKVNPEQFIDFYSAKGWKIGQNPMKDWKAAVRTWEQRDRAPAQAPVKQVRAAQYTQREYDEDDLEARLGVNDIFKKGAS